MNGIVSENQARFKLSSFSPPVSSAQALNVAIIHRPVLIQDLDLRKSLSICV